MSTHSRGRSIDCRRVNMKKSGRGKSYWERNFTVRELRKIAKKYHIKGYSRMKKDELMDIILNQLSHHSSSSPSRELYSKTKAISIIETWWKRKMVFKNAICPITMEKISSLQETPFSLVEPVDGAVFFFSPKDLAEYMMISLYFINP